MTCPWSIVDEMEQYCKKHPYVSSACRLSTEEELLLLQLCSLDAQDKLSLSLLNRKAYVSAVTTLSSLPPDKTLSVKLGGRKTPKFENFDEGADLTILTNPKKTLLSSKVFGVAYARPEEVHDLIKLDCDVLYPCMYSLFILLFFLLDRTKLLTAVFGRSNSSTML